MSLLVDLDNTINFERIVALKEHFNSHYGTTHPVLTKIWIDTLDICEKQIISIKKTLEQGEKLIERLPESVNDPSVINILTLLSILTQREQNANGEQQNANEQNANEQNANNYII